MKVELFRPQEPLKEDKILKNHLKVAYKHSNDEKLRG